MIPQTFGALVLLDQAELFSEGLAPRLRLRRAVLTVTFAPWPVFLLRFPSDALRSAIAVHVRGEEEEVHAYSPRDMAIR